MNPFLLMTMTVFFAVSAAAGIGCAAETRLEPEPGGAAATPAPGPVAEAVSNAVAHADEAVGEWRAGDVFAYRAGEWTLELTYLNRGTRSEGQDGRLLKGGTPVEGKEKGQTLETPMGMLRFYGTERRQKWDNTGWNFADRRRIKRSDDLPAPPATAP